MTAQLTSLTELYEQDETAWLDAMAELVAERRFDEFDLEHLQEFLTDMANRDRKEVRSRLTVLLTHLLKYRYQSERRSRSWQSTIVVQRQELVRDASSGVLHSHAKDVLPDAYVMAVERASTQTGLPSATFPKKCPWSLHQLFTDDLLKE